MQKTIVRFTACLMLSGLVACATQTQLEYLSNTPVRVTELHVDPSDEQGDVEFIEIANVTNERVDISGWQVTGAGRMSLPAGTELDPKTALVICEDIEALRKTFGAEAVATFDGKLNNSGETIRIEDPGGLVADEVTYDKDDPEVEKASETGLSIHRVRGSKDNVMWRASEPTPGRLN